MSGRPSDPPPEVRALRDAERDWPVPSEDAIARVWERVRVRVGAVGGGEGGGAAGAPPPAAPADGSVSSRRLSSRALGATLGFLLGAGVGAGLHGWLVPPVVVRERVVVRILAPTADTGSRSNGANVTHEAAPPPRMVVDAPAVPRRAARARRPRVAPPPEGSLPSPGPSATDERDAGASVLADELALLDRMTNAIRRGHARAALDAVEEHSRRFSQRGQFSSMREAIRVRALVLLGRYDEARGVGERFMTRWPDAPERAQVQRALGEIH